MTNRVLDLSESPARLHAENGLLHVELAGAGRRTFPFSSVAAIVCGILFLVALVIAPLFGAVPAQATAPALIVVGDVTPDEILPKLERAFASWKPAEVPSVAIPTAAGQRAGLYIVDRPGAAQSVIQIGQVGVERTTPDYFPLLVLNTILGGQFVSRVNLNLRESKGYTYGARTAFDFRRGAGPFIASAGVFTGVTKESVEEFLKELRGVRGEIPITPRELEYAKQALIRGFPRGFETPGQIAARLEDIVIYGLPDDYFNRYIERVRAVTLDDVNRVAKRYLDPSRLTILVVGDRRAIEAGLRSLPELGTKIMVVDPEGRIVASGEGASESPR